MKWTPMQFRELQKIAKRHDIHCPLRIAMVTGDDANGTRVCKCNGKLNRWGEPKTTPREQTLEEVLAQLGLDAETDEMICLRCDGVGVLVKNNGYGVAVDEKQCPDCDGYGERSKNEPRDK